MYGRSSAPLWPSLFSSRRPLEARNVRPPSSDDWPGTDGLDRLLEHRTRLAICVLLVRHDAISFSRFKELFDETDGISAHSSGLWRRLVISACGRSFAIESP